MIRSLVQNAYQAVRDALATGAVSFGGTLTALSNVILAGAVTFTGSGVATIAAGTGSVTDLSTAQNRSILRLTTSGVVSLYSLNGAANQIIWLVNTSANVITIKHDDGATGTAALRFLCPGSADYALAANEAVLCWYDGTSSRWRVFGTA